MKLYNTRIGNIKQVPEAKVIVMPLSIEQKQLAALENIAKLLGELVDNTRPSGTKASYGSSKRK